MGVVATHGIRFGPNNNWSGPFNFAEYEYAKAQMSYNVYYDILAVAKWNDATIVGSLNDKLELTELTQT